MHTKLLEIISVGFDITDQPLIRFFSFVRYWRKKWEYNETVCHLFIDFKKAYDSVRREVLFRYSGMTLTYQNLIHEEDCIWAMLGTSQFRIFCLLSDV
jgi:hypothetical protein